MSKQDPKWIIRIRRIDKPDAAPTYLYASGLGLNQGQHQYSPKRRRWNVVLTQARFAYRFESLSEAKKALRTVQCIKDKLKPIQYSWREDALALYFAEIVKVFYAGPYASAGGEVDDYREHEVELRKGELPPLLALALEAE